MSRHEQRVEELMFPDAPGDALFRPGVKGFDVARCRFERALVRLKRPTGRTVIELGAYPGNGYYFFGEANRVIGLGAGDDAFGVRAQELGHEFHSCDFESPGFSRGWEQRGEIVLCMELLEHIRNPQRFISEAVRVVAPGGVLYLTTNNASYVGYILKLLAGSSPLDPIASEGSGYPGHTRYYQLGEVVQILRGVGLRESAASRINLLPPSGLYRNRGYGALKNGLLRLLPRRYATHIEVTASP